MRVSNFLAASLLFISCTSHKEAKPPVEKVNFDTVRINDGKNIKIIPVETKPFPESMEFNGRITVSDKDLFSIPSRVSGRIERLEVSIGDKVSKGQSLATLWSSDLVTASEEYSIAKKEGGRLLKLTEQKLQSLGINPAEASPDKTVFSLHSPVDGVVLEKKMNSGSNINPGDIIVTVGKSESLQFSGELPPERAVRVKRGMKVIFEELKDLEATIESVSPVSDPVTHLVKVRANFKTMPPSSTPQESFLKAQIILDEFNAMVFPTKSLIMRSDGEYIFVSLAND